MRSKALWIGLILIVFSPELYGQLSLTLDDCQNQAQVNYPLIKKRDLVERSKAYAIEKAAKGYLPQFIINAQATYQSAVTEIPIQMQGIEIPQLTKDQYKFYGELNQTIYDGGNIKQKIELHRSTSAIEEQSLSVALYQLKDRINQLFFSILMIEEQLNQNQLLMKDIQLGLDKVEAAVTNGTALEADLNVLKAELLKAAQHAVDLKANRTAYLEVLGLFLNKTLDASTKLIKPELPILPKTIQRPELALYDDQLTNIAVQEELINVRNRPRLDFFFQGGYGRPALNILKPRFDAYYIGGLRLSWNLGGLYTQKKEKAILEINRLAIGVEKETFLFNTHSQAKRESVTMRRYQDLLQSDNEIIALREKVKKTAVTQLEHGVITTNDYLREVNAEDQARLNKIIHEIQLLASQYDYLYITGDTY
uniref:Outer membrane efflux protein n=1 Tax=Sphingobacterium sp. (strain 21) TaxID=743722 RepID=F4C8L0_SPHS2